MPDVIMFFDPNLVSAYTPGAAHGPNRQRWISAAYQTHTKICQQFYHQYCSVFTASLKRVQQRTLDTQDAVEFPIIFMVWPLQSDNGVCVCLIKPMYYCTQISGTAWFWLVSHVLQIKLLWLHTKLYDWLVSYIVFLVL